ncbi:MAG: single-stranded DNA-binding protein [Nonomuraea sp.]|nr:single-stranded DNA-binding protein [Nonomuraea sp.]NUT45678.1 single-stranded DNA-binding protein [Thermoactinospora sp.]
MNDIYITLTGNVAAEPRQYSFDDGTRVTSLKVFTSHRYFDRKTGQWTDGERVCFTVRCWRALGDNVADCVRAGQPVVVSGKLRIREFGAEGDRRFMPEIEASAVGHDLRWGTGAFTKPERGGGLGSMTKEMRERLDEETQDWAMGAKPLRTAARLASTTEADPVHAFTAEGDPTHLADLETAPALNGTAAPADPVDAALAGEVIAPDPATQEEGPRDAGAREQTGRGSGARSDTVRVLPTSGKNRDTTKAPEKARAAA